MPLNYTHPTIVVDEPAPGHYAVTGHNPASVFIEGEGHIVPPHVCYIAPEVPSELLEAILHARGHVFSVEGFETSAPAVAASAPAPTEKKEHWKTREKRERAAVGKTSCGAEV